MCGLHADFWFFISTCLEILEKFEQNRRVSMQFLTPENNFNAPHIVHIIYLWAIVVLGLNSLRKSHFFAYMQSLKTRASQLIFTFAFFHE